MLGRVLWFDVKKGFGFIRADDDNRDIFVHYSKIIAEDGEFRTLDENEKVEFELVTVERIKSSKPQAHNVKRMGGGNEVPREKRTDDIKGHGDRPKGDKTQ